MLETIHSTKEHFLMSAGSILGSVVVLSANLVGRHLLASKKTDLVSEYYVLSVLLTVTSFVSALIAIELLNANVFPRLLVYSMILILDAHIAKWPLAWKWLDTQNNLHLQIVLFVPLVFNYLSVALDDGGTAWASFACILIGALLRFIGANYEIHEAADMKLPATKIRPKHAINTAK